VKDRRKKEWINDPKNSCAHKMARNVRFLLHVRLSSLSDYLIYHHSRACQLVLCYLVPAPPYKLLLVNGT
jgi:hypothetical protein